MVLAHCCLLCGSSPLCVTALYLISCCLSCPSPALINCPRDLLTCFHLCLALLLAPLHIALFVNWRNPSWSPCSAEWVNYPEGLKTNMIKSSTCKSSTFLVGKIDFNKAKSPPWDSFILFYFYICLKNSENMMKFRKNEARVRRALQTVIVWRTSAAAPERWYDAIPQNRPFKLKKCICWWPGIWASSQEDEKNSKNVPPLPLLSWLCALY